MNIAPVSPLRLLREMRVVGISDPTPTIRELDIECKNPDQFEFKAGQFVMLHVPVPGQKDGLRAYSIASSDKIAQGFRLIFKYVENGLASNYVWGLKGNESLIFTGPFGKVLFQTPPPPQVIFLNTGSGISQHLSFLLSKGKDYPEVAYRLLFGVRNESDIFGREALDQIQQSLPNFTYDFVLSQPSHEWKGRSGYIQHHLAQFEYKKIDSIFYLCGNGHMIKEVKTQLLERDGLPTNRVWAEAFD